MKKNRRRGQKRNLFSYYNRRKRQKNGGYSKDSICPGCGKATVEKGRFCSDCQRETKCRVISYNSIL